MVNDYAEIANNAEINKPNCDGENDTDNPLELPTTTTISTIALQSGNTRLVIALLQSGSFLKLKVLEIYPELSKLGVTVETATDLATAHDEVLIHLKNKQSPVEELLRQADHLISTQKPRAEVYAAMADTLGQAWKDVNAFLELRKQILDHNVLFQCCAEEFKINATALEIICTDEQLPIEIESVKKMISKIHDVRRDMLSTLLSTLQEGKVLIEQLREAIDGELDLLPDPMRGDVENAIVHVEKNLEEIHEQRKITEMYFNTRKNQLEQCLALALLAIDLRSLEVTLNEKIAAFKSNGNHLGDSCASTEGLLLDLRNLQQEAKIFQDRLLKITKSTEKLVLDGHFASEQATEKAYTILEKAAEYINQLENYEYLLNRVGKFFDSVQTAVVELNYLEMKLSNNTYQIYSAEYMNFYTQAIESLSKITMNSITEGYEILEIVGKGTPGAEGVRQAVEELENRKLKLHERCTSCIEENLMACDEFTKFFDKYETLKTWLELTIEAFIRDNANLGNDFSMAQTFYKQHEKLLQELRKRENDVHECLSKFNNINVDLRNDEGKIFQKEDIDKYTHGLKDKWLIFDNIIDARLHLSSLYIAIHEKAANLYNDFDVISNQINESENLEENGMPQNFGKKLGDLGTLYSELKNDGENFISEINKNTDPYLDKSHPRNVVEIILENFTAKRLSITESWEHWKMSMTITRQMKTEQETIIKEIVKVLELLSSAKNRLFCKLNVDALTPSAVIENLETMQNDFLSKLDTAFSRLHSKINNSNRYENLWKIMQQNEKQCHELYNNLQTIVLKYKDLLQDFVEMLEFVKGLEHKCGGLLQTHAGKKSPSLMISESKIDIQENINEISEFNAAIDRILLKESTGPEMTEKISGIDMEQLKRIDHRTFAYLMKMSSELRGRIQKCLVYSRFAENLNSIDEEIRQLGIQLQGIREFHQYFSGDEISLVKSTSDAFKNVNEIISTVETKVNKFIITTEKNIETIYDSHSASKIRDELANLKKKWNQLELSVKEIQKRIDATVEYFKLLQEIENWYAELKKLLEHATKKSVGEKIPRHPEDTLNAIKQYLEKGEEQQEKRIKKIRELSTEIFGTQRLPQFNKVIMDNQETLDLCAVTISELRTLADNMDKADKIRRENSEENGDESKAIAKSTSDGQAAIEQQRDNTKVEKTTTIITESTIHIQKKATFTDNSTIDVNTIILKKPTAIADDECINREISGPPIFIKQLESISVKIGASPTIECTVEGNPLPIVQWYRNETNIDDSPDYIITYNNGQAKLKFLEITPEDRGLYTCKARNKHGEASTAAMVELIKDDETCGTDEIEKLSRTFAKSDDEKMTAAVDVPQFTPPSIKLHLQDLRVHEGGSATLDCIIIGQPEPEVIWYHDDHLVKESPDLQLLFQGDKCSLIIHEVVMSDFGRYKVVAVNSEGKISSECALLVQPIEISEIDTKSKRDTMIPPFFSATLEDRYKSVGESAKFECTVHGTPVPEIQWLFNDKPVRDCQNFSISAEGDRRILKIPEITGEHVGSISCIAENIAGKVTCTAKLDIHEGIEEKDVIETDDRIDMQPSSSCERYLQLETNSAVPHQIGQDEITKMSSSTSQSLMSKSSCIKEYKLSSKSNILDSCPLNSMNGIPALHIESRKCVNEINGGQPNIQTHKVEEFQRIIRDAPDKIQHEKLKIISDTTPKIQKQTRKNITPRFITPITGMIVDQGSNVILEGVIDGFPQPKITWSKNGQDVDNNVKTSFEHNHVRLELKNVNVKDAGRYTCTAINEVGNASSTADLVVKKTIFPPVFGKRLQAQIAKTGERVIMEVEITGTPEPTVTWYKDDEPLMDTDGELRQLGNCYLLIIERAEKRHAGKYMVNAANAGGEAQSIADFAVFEPTPDTMVEVHKTIVYENMADKDLKLDEKKSQLPSAALTAEHIATTMIQPSPILKTLVPPPSSTTPLLRRIELITPTTSTKTSKKTEEIVEKATRSEMISSTIESHQSETKSEQKFHMKLQHEAPDLIIDNAKESSSTRLVQDVMKKMDTKTVDSTETQDNDNIETSVLAKKDALNFFESMAKEGETAPKINRAVIDLNEEAKDGNYDVKVDKLTKNYERSTKFEEVRGSNETEVQSKKLVQNISNKLQNSGMKDKGIENVMIDFPYDNYKLPLLNTQRTILEDTTASGSPIHGTLTISKLAAQSESAEKMLSGFNLTPGPPPEIDYMPKRTDDAVEKRTDVLSKTKQLEQFQTTSCAPPVGGVQIFPSGHQSKKTDEKTKMSKSQMVSFNESSDTMKDTSRKYEETENVTEKWWSSTSNLETRSDISTDLSDYRCQSAASFSQLDRSLSPKPSVDGLAMEKAWAKKADTSRKSWPPLKSYPNTSNLNDHAENNEPLTSKVTSHEKREEVSEIPGCGITKTKIESSSSLETRSWNSKENRMEETVIEKPGIIPNSSPKSPIYTPQVPVKMYKAETIKVDHTLNSNEEQSITKKYSSQCKVDESYQTSQKISALEKLEAPNLVKAATSSPRSAPVQLYHNASDNASSCMRNGKAKDFQSSSSIFRGTLATAPKHSANIQLYKTNTPTLSTDPGIILEPGTPPEIGYIPMSVYEEKNIMTEKTVVRNPVEIPPPFQRQNFSAESDFESDFGSYKSKCRSCESDHEEPKYRRVKAPIPKQPRPKSAEPEPLPPSSFEIPPPELTGPSRPMSMAMPVSSRQQERGGIDFLTPGSPPTYVQSNIKPDSPKMKSRLFEKVSGYMADTDEPINNSTKTSSFSKNYEKSESVFMSSSNQSYKSSSTYGSNDFGAPKESRGLFKFAGSESWTTDPGNNYSNRISMAESRNETKKELLFKVFETSSIRSITNGQFYSL
uniref:Unc-89_2 protein n=1 Tax=Fopius arisanus TaxID=64838 RepID=A0A0C9RAI6_9HYME